MSKDIFKVQHVWECWHCMAFRVLQTTAQQSCRKATRRGQIRHSKSHFVIARYISDWLEVSNTWYEPYISHIFDLYRAFASSQQVHLLALIKYTCFLYLHCWCADRGACMACACSLNQRIGSLSLLQVIQIFANMKQDPRTRWIIWSGVTRLASFPTQTRRHSRSNILSLVWIQLTHLK